MNKLVSILITILSSFYFTNAQLQGQVNYDELGISFTIPDGWQGQEGEDMIVLGSNTIAGLVIITTHTSNKNELIQEAKAGIVDQNGTNMQLEESIETLTNNAVAGMFTGTMEYQQAKAYVIGMVNPNEGGIGVTIMSVSTAEAFSQANKDVATELYQSFKFKKIDKSSELAEWKEWLSNVRLTYMDSYYSPSSTDGGVGGGYSNEERIDLCSAGYFLFNSNNEMTISGDNVSGYNSGGNSGNGTWKIVARGNQLVLLLKYHTGQESSYNLEYKDEKLYLNGYRYYRTTEGEYAPNCQ